MGAAQAAPPFAAGGALLLPGNECEWQTDQSAQHIIGLGLAGGAGRGRQCHSTDTAPPLWPPGRCARRNEQSACGADGTAAHAMPGGTDSPAQKSVAACEAWCCETAHMTFTKAKAGDAAWRFTSRRRDCTPPLRLVGVSIGMERRCQQNDSPADG